MNRRIIPLILFSLFASISYSQQLKWVIPYAIQEVKAVSTDDSGYVYVVGYFRSTTDMDPSTLGTDFKVSNSHKDDPFLTKFDPSGNYIWSITLSGPRYDEGTDIWIDDSSNIFLTGHFSGTMDFDPGPGTHNLTVSGNQNGYVLKLDRNGKFIWARDFGNGGLVGIRDMKLDDAGNIYTTGYFYNNTDFDPGADTFELLNPFTNRDVFVSKLDKNGDFKWAVSAGARSADCEPEALTLLDNGNIAIVGDFTSTVDFDPDTSTVNLSSFINTEDGFLWILDSTGNYVNALNIARGTGRPFIADVTHDTKSNMYVVGSFQGINDFDPSTKIARDLNARRGNDVFVAKYDSTGLYQWAVPFGSGTNSQLVSSITYGADGLLNVVGRFKDTIDFDPGPDSSKLISTSFNMFHLKLDSDHDFQSVHSTGTVHSSGVVTPHDIHVSDSGHLFIVGQFTRTVDFDMTSDTHVVANAGTMRFIMKTESCDSLTYDSLTVATCKSYTSPSGNHTWTKSGIYTDILSGDNQYGCDSVITIDLTVTYDVDTSITDTVCGFLTSPSGKYVWDTSGIFYDTITTKVGCDTSYTFHLTVLPVKDSTWSEIVCDSMLSPSKKRWWTTSGTYLDTIDAANGCDSIITINLTVNPSSHVSIFPSTCGPYNAPSGRYTWSTSGTYSDTLINQFGCDSILTIHLTAQASSFAVIGVKECISYTSPSGKYTWTSSGIYHDTLTNSVGCDSLMIINLSITQSPLTIEQYGSCSGVLSPSGRYIWTSSGTYYDTLTNQFACDSVIEAHVKIYPETTNFINISTCGWYTSPSGKYTWTSTGLYMDTIPNTTGCDSVITFDLTLGQQTKSTISPVVCDGFRSPSGRYFWTTSGSYSDTLVNSTGCDSIIDIVLSIQTANKTVIKESSCGPFETSDGRILTTSGVYSDTLVNQYGCDSILSIDLEVITIDTSLYLLDDLLIANATSGRFQWLDCENNMNTINGATERAFAYQKSGIYAVEIFDGFCVDTSSCVSVHSSSIQDPTLHGIKVYPNPTSSILHIDIDALAKGTNYVLYTSTGQRVLQGDVNARHVEMALPDASGIYTLQLTVEGERQFIRVVKE